MLNPVTKPAWYYNDGKSTVGPLDYAEQQSLEIKQHAVIKYVTRAGRKPGNTALKDYKQAKFYLDRLIAEEEAKLNTVLGGVGQAVITGITAFPEGSQQSYIAVPTYIGPDRRHASRRYHYDADEARKTGYRRGENNGRRSGD